MAAIPQVRRAWSDGRSSEWQRNLRGAGEVRAPKKSVRHLSQSPITATPSPATMNHHGRGMWRQHGCLTTSPFLGGARPEFPTPTPTALRPSRRRSRGDSPPKDFRERSKRGVGPCRQRWPMSTEVGVVDNAAVVVCDVGEEMRAWLVRESLSSASDGRCFTVRVDV